MLNSGTGVVGTFGGVGTGGVGSGGLGTSGVGTGGVGTGCFLAVLELTVLEMAALDLYRFFPLSVLLAAPVFEINLVEEALYQIEVKKKPLR